MRPLRAVVVAAGGARARQFRLAGFCRERGYTLIATTASVADAWRLCIAGDAEVVVVDDESEVPTEPIPRVESLQGERRKAKQRRRQDRLRRPEVLPR